MDALTAPARVPVEVTRRIGGSDRCFRLSARLGAGRIELALPVPLVDGEPAGVRFSLPESSELIEVEAEVAGQGHVLVLRGVGSTERMWISEYVKERLELPDV